MTNIEAKTSRRPLLWAALAVSALCNATTSIIGLGAVSIAFGVLTLLCGAALVLHHRRH